jgi:selenocysteine lyase/cysteine desulfurase
MIPSEIIKIEFPGLSGKTYLNAGALSLAPQRAIQAVERMVAIASARVDASAGQIWGEMQRG